MTKSKNQAVGLNEVEQNMLAEVCIKGGYRPSEAMRTGLRMLHNKLFPSYVVKSTPKQPIAPVSAKDWCTEQGGSIIEEEGQKYCILMDGNLEKRIAIPDEYI